MIRERRYRWGSRGRSPSPRRPRRRSRDASPPGYRKLSQNSRHGTDEYLRVGKTSRMSDKMDHFDDRAPRFDDRDRDRDSFVGRGFRSPRRIEERVNVDRPVNLSNYVDGADDRDRDRFGGRTFRSPRRIEERVNVDRPVSLSNYGDGADDRDRDRFGGMPFRSPRRIEERVNGDRPLSLSNYGSQKYDHLSLKNYSPARGSSGVGGGNIDVSSSDRDYYMQNRYMDSSQAGFPVSRFSDSTKPVSSNYLSEGKYHSHSYSLARSRVDDITVNGLSVDRSSHMPYVASQCLNTEADKDRDFRVQNELHMEKNDGLHNREDNYFDKKSSAFNFQDKYMRVGKSVESIYKFKEDDNLLSSRGYLKGNSDCLASSSSSQIKNYDPVPLGISREPFSGFSPSRKLHMPPSDVIRVSGVAPQPIAYDGYSEKKQTLLSTESGGQFGDLRSGSRLYDEFPRERQGDWSYAEFGRRKTDVSSRRLNDVEDDYKEKHIFRTDVLKHNLDARSHNEHIEEDGRRDRYSSFQVLPPPDKFDSRGSEHVIRENIDTLGNGSSCLNYGYGDVKTDHTNDGEWSHSDSTFGRLYGSPRGRLPDLNLSEPRRRRLGDKHARDRMLYEHDYGIRISSDGNSRRVYNQVDLDNEIDLAYSSKRPKSSRRDYDCTWRLSSELGSDEPSPSEFSPCHSVKPYKSNSRDIKKRLGPMQKLHVSERIVKKHKPSIKKRLANAPRNRHATLPWIKNMSSSNTTSDQMDRDGGVQDRDGDNHLTDRVPLAKAEPSEKSEEFKQLVENAFFKFLKQISETQSKRKTYMEQVTGGILKCFVCGSNSEEFTGTEGLAMHAFTSKTAGLRSQHLGLHKALCALMGWKVTEQPSREWHREIITAAEAQALKEDLIIWPPVVVIHNSTIDSASDGERVIVSTEKLDTKLRDRGFGSILKVCNGKPANQSVMLVKFNGTLSGLQEAERFHQSYIESKQGRAELSRLKSTAGSSSGDSSRREEKFLYGYMGIAEDLDKLDSDTKKRCVLRSKKQILRIVDAPIDAEGEAG